MNEFEIIYARTISPKIVWNLAAIWITTCAPSTEEPSMNFLNSIAHAVRCKPDQETRAKIDFVIGTHFPDFTLAWEQSDEFHLYFLYNGPGLEEDHYERIVEVSASYREPHISEAHHPHFYEMFKGAAKLKCVSFPGLPNAFEAITDRKHPEPPQSQSPII